MDRWKRDFLDAIKSGKTPDQAAKSSAGMPLAAVEAMRPLDLEFSDEWDKTTSMVTTVGSGGTLMPMLPDTEDIKELCKAVSIETTKRLIDIALHSESETNALKAISEINDRGWGKPSQAVQHSGEIDIGLAGMLDAARQRRLEDKS